MPTQPTTRGPAATITHVAEAAGVSIKTVSRVINQEPGVNPQTRDRVLSAVAKLRYRPKLSARSLAGARSFLIGLLYYDPSAAYVGRVQQGATVRCREAGYHLVVESLHDDGPALGAQVEHMVSALAPDGMILTPPLCDNSQVLKTHKVPVIPQLVHDGKFTFSSGLEAAHHLLSRRVKPTAVFASNDDMALGVLAAAQRLGLAVPGDISIAGFDDSIASDLVWPTLTTVRQPMEEMARVAVDMLIGKYRNDAGSDPAQVPHEVLQHQLLVRDSTSAPAGSSRATRKRD